MTALSVVKGALAVRAISAQSVVAAHLADATVTVQRLESL